MINNIKTIVYHRTLGAIKITAFPTSGIHPSRQSLWVLLWLVFLIGGTIPVGCIVPSLVISHPKAQCELHQCPSAVFLLLELL